MDDAYEDGYEDGWNRAIEAAEKVAEKYKHIPYQGSHFIGFCDVVNAQKEIAKKIKGLKK